MKSKKLFLVGILVMMLVFLVGCGTQENEEKKDVNNANTEEPAKEKETENISRSNVGTFIEYNGDIYYWKMDSGSREESALFANYTELTNYKNSLVKLQDDGTETVITKDTGSGKVCIINGKIFYESRATNEVQICSINIDGEEKTEHTEGSLKYVVDNYIYVQSGNDISVIDANKAEVNTIVKEASIVGIADKNVYYTKSISNNDIKSMEIGYINGLKDSGTVASFNSSEYSDEYANDSNVNVTFVDFEYRENKVMVDVGFVAGTGLFVQEGWTITMDKDGKNASKSITESNGEASESLIGVSDNVVVYNNGLVYTNPETGKETTIITEDELISKLGFKKDEDGIYEVYSADVIGDEIYITVDSGTHNPEEDMGWRYSYKRSKTVAFKYNIKTSDIKKIYEF